MFEIQIIYQTKIIEEKRIEIDWDIGHPDDPLIGLIHSVILMKKIVAVYVSIRLKHYCKLYRPMYLDKNIRKNMTKTILFKNQ